MRGVGTKVGDLLLARLATDPRIHLVDREDLLKLLEEQELSLSGLVRPDEAVRIGQLTGAKLIVTGSVFQVDQTLYLIAKVIGTETSAAPAAAAASAVSDM